MTETVHEIARQNRSRLRTPYYLLDESRLLKNLEKIEHVRERSGAKSVLALKCFSTWSVFPLMSRYMDGTTSSSLYEAKLGHGRFGGECSGSRSGVGSPSPTRATRSTSSATASGRLRRSTACRCIWSPEMPR